MFKVIINETGAQEELSITRNGINYVSDFIGNMGALSDGQFTYDNEQSAYGCDQDTFDWWQRVMADHQEMNDRIIALSDKYGSDKVHAVTSKIGDYDLEDQPAAINSALDEAFPGE